MVHLHPGPRARAGSANLLQSALSILLGTGFTFCLFMGIARFLKSEPTQILPDIDELHAVSLQITPPPPPRKIETETAAALPDIPSLGFEAAASDSVVKITASPPTFEVALPSDQIPPHALIRIGTIEGTFKPKLDLTIDREHIYQTHEVDKLPSVLSRDDPRIPSYIHKDDNFLRVTVIFVVDSKGAVGNVRVLRSSGNPPFDSIISASMRQWMFSPAIKKGKPVKCLVQQTINVKWGSSSPFALQ